MTDLRKLLSELGVRCPHKKLPDDYLVIDLETSGFDWRGMKGRPDVIVQIGYAAVKNREIVDNGCSATYIKRPIGTMKGKALEITGITDQILQDKGEDAATFYPKFVNLLETYRASGGMFVGHNILAFDTPFLLSELEKHGIDFDFEDGEFIDTGCIFKAAQMGLFPGPKETIGDFLFRVREIRDRTKWNLSFAAKELYVDVDHDIDLEKAHDAGIDCQLTHHLFETLRVSPKAEEVVRKLHDERKEKNKSRKARR